MRLKKDNLNLYEKMEGITRRRDDLESYLRSLAKKLFIKLEGIYFVPTDVFFCRLSIRKLTYPWIVNAEFCQDFEEETGRIEPSLDPINSPVKDEAAMNVLRLGSRITGVVDYLARLRNVAD